jgi:ABC-type Fe3+/spermidine/putrescine transport system ATPase subunit
MSDAVAVEALSLTLGAFRLKKLGFSLSRGEILVILGPNGSGKSVTLETIAGFHRPDAGRIVLAGRDVTMVPPERRKIGFVVQNFGLFPHLNVAQNVAIAQRPDPAGAFPDARLPHGDSTALLSYFGIDHLADRSPATLSPGEQQRVALARALASAPDLFLFDEPFSALDAETRAQLRAELKTFLRALAIPAIFVTHDHDEAMALADTVVVLRDGGIVQSGSAAEVFNKPASSFVARFVGVENILAGRVTARSGNRLTFAVSGQVLHATAPAGVQIREDSAGLAIRAEHVAVSPLPIGVPVPSAANTLPGRIKALRVLGPLATIEIECGFSLKAYLLSPQVQAMGLSEGSAVIVQIRADAIHVMAE